MDQIVTYLQVRSFPVIRIVCHHQGCGAAVELKPDLVEGAMKKTNGCCPICGKPFTKPDVEGGADVATMLARAIIAIDQLASHVRIELPLQQNVSA